MDLREPDSHLLSGNSFSRKKQSTSPGAMSEEDGFVRGHRIEDTQSFDEEGEMHSPDPEARAGFGFAGRSAWGGIREGNLLVCIVILSKTILGAGMTAIPRTYHLLGILLATAMLMLVGFLTHISVMYIIRASVRTGHMSYPDVTGHLFGRVGATILQISLVARCFGLMLVYMIVAGDILAGGGEGYPGLLCDLVGPSGSSWCSNRPLIILGATLLAFGPLCSFKHITSAAATSYIGLSAVVVWALSTIVLLLAALAQGAEKGTSFFPDVSAYGGGLGSAALQVLGIVPILSTAYTCQMAVHFVAADLQPFSEHRVALMSGWAHSICCTLFFIVGAASYVIFGADVRGDVLINLTRTSMTNLVGKGLGSLLYYLIRLGFLLSVVTIFPMQMQPYRESFMKLFFRRELTGWKWSAVTYCSLGVILIPGYCFALCGALYR
eukprot:jgi/Botrbrau1/11634/Bobra.0209s0024.1